VILLALVLAAAAPQDAAGHDDRVVMVARPRTEPGALSRIGSGLSRAFHRLYEKDDPTVDKGNALSAEGDVKGALQEYDDARKRLADSPELAYDRSTALVKSDPEKAPEAASEALQALQKGDAALKAKAAYQLGVAQEAMGKPEDAMKSYGAALALDPDDEDAKVNLELLLKTQEERKQKQPQAQQQQDKKNQQEKKDQQQQSKGGEDKDKKQDKPQQGNQQEKQQQAQDQKGQEQAKPEQKQELAQAPEKPVDRSEAERLLDALRASEKNLQSWRFAKDKRKNVRRNEPEKDW
jgi:Ca-activated chloride channel family protein